jgi:hypothetical protein
VLAESWLAHHVGSRFFALVVDGLPKGAEAGSGIEVVEPNAFGLPRLDELAFEYEVVELATALKPPFLRYLLDRESALVYLDPDMLVLQQFEAFERTLAGSAIVLTPHSLSPYPRDGLRPSEEGILNTGVFNLGFLGLRRAADVDALLDWWEPHVLESSRIDYLGGRFFDQKWMDLAPAYFGSTAVLRDPAYNVAYWNLHERPLEWLDSTFLVHSKPVVCFHFSGYDPAQPTSLTSRVASGRARTDVVEASALARLLAAYSELHDRHGFAECSSWEYGFARFENGIGINRIFRQLYVELDEGARERFGNPFAADEGSFFSWATRAGADGLSPFLARIYESRDDLRTAFPEVGGRDRDRFLEWARLRGPVEVGYEPTVVLDP